MTMYKSLTNQVKDKKRAWQEKIDKLDGTRNGTEFWNSFFRLTNAKSRGTRKTLLTRSDSIHTKIDWRYRAQSTIKEHEMLFKPL